MLIGLAVFSAAVAGVALVVAAVSRSAFPAVWILAVWAALVLACSYRAVAMRVRHRRAFATLRMARRKLRAGQAYELRSMAADSPEPLEQLVGERCAHADALGQTLFIESKTATR